MKRVRKHVGLSLACLVGFLVLSSCVTTTNQVVYENIRTATGTFQWAIQDKDGNTITSGTVVNGEWKTGGGILVDVLILEKDVDDNITVAFMPIAAQSGRFLPDFRFQVFYNGVVYPGPGYGENFVFNLIDHNDYNQLVFSWGTTDSAHRSMSGCFNTNITVNEGKSFQCDLGGEYTFVVLGPTNYSWIKE